MSAIETHGPSPARSGRGDAYADHVVHLFELVRAGVFAPVTDDFQRLTGNPPRSLEGYAKEVWRR